MAIFKYVFKKSLKPVETSHARSCHAPLIHPRKLFNFHVCKATSIHAFTWKLISA